MPWFHQGRQIDLAQGNKVNTCSGGGKMYENCVYQDQCNLFSRLHEINQGEQDLRIEA